MTCFRKQKEVQCNGKTLLMGVVGSLAFIFVASTETSFAQKQTDGKAVTEGTRTFRLREKDGTPIWSGSKRGKNLGIWWA